MVQALLLLSRWIAVAHDRWCASIADRRPMSVEIAVLKERVERLRSENELLRERLGRLEPRRRPHYRPWERLRILWHQARYRMSLAATGKAFLVTVQTLVNWRRAVEQGERPEVDGRTPIRRISDAAAEIARRLKREWPRWGSRRIAGILARLGVAASRTTVQRILRRPLMPPTTVADVRPSRGPLVAKRPGHVWFIDFTRVGGLLRSVVVGAVIDGFSRKVLAIGVAAHEPTARFAVQLFREAVRKHGAPTWMLSDHGTQFTSSPFTRALRRLGVGHRYGAVGRKGSISLIERFWRSMKEEHAHGLALYRPLASTRTRLRAYATWFNAHRPHQGLDNLTPDEVHRGSSTRPTSVPLRAALEVHILDDNQDLPVLTLRHAA